MKEVPRGLVEYSHYLESMKKLESVGSRSPNVKCKERGPSTDSKLENTVSLREHLSGTARTHTKL